MNSQDTFMCREIHTQFELITEMNIHAATNRISGIDTARSE